MDFFTVPTNSFKILYVYFIIDHARRKIIHVNITEHPTAEWVVQQLKDALNQMVIFNEKQLHDLMKQYVEYYNNDRCHLSVDRDSPNGREIQNKPFGSARVISSARIGGLHTIYINGIKLLKLIPKEF